jgi:Ser-tRNA(Ala) deacylase AlaX
MEWIYLQDAYLREFDATVLACRENSVFLDKSAFYPGGGGQPCDTGEIISSAGVARVIRVESEVHVIDGILPRNNEVVHCILNWERRYKIMRTHTAVHVISGVAYKRFGVTITGNQLYEGSARLDLSFENMSKELAQKIVEESNIVAASGLEVRAYMISREEFSKNPDLMRVNPELYQKYEHIRVVEITGFDAQADGGTHVRNTSEIGKIKFRSYESKGKKNKRIYIDLE